MSEETDTQFPDKQTRAICCIEMCRNHATQPLHEINMVGTTKAAGPRPQKQSTTSEPHKVKHTSHGDLLVVTVTLWLSCYVTLGFFTLHMPDQT